VLVIDDFMKIVSETFIDEMEAIKQQLLKKEIPESYPEDISRMIPIEMMILNRDIERNNFIDLSSFALVSNRWVKPLAEYIGNKKCLEIMAGRGVLSKALSECGVDIIATDNFSWTWRNNDKEKGSLTQEQLWFHVENLDNIQAIEKYGKDMEYIICSWPDYSANYMYKALLKMREVNPNCKLIYIGEGYGGCTADDDFHESFEIIKDDIIFNNIAEKFQRWWGIRDRLTIGV